MDEEKYLDLLGNPLAGDKLYRSRDNKKLYITYSRPSNVDPVWYATSLYGDALAGISEDEAKQLIPASKEEVLREFERAKNFAKDKLEKITDHDNIPSVVEVASKVHKRTLANQ